MSEQVPGNEATANEAADAETAQPTPEATQSVAEGAPAQDAGMAERLAAAEELASERTADLQRLQAEYVNYKRRVDRDRTLARQQGMQAMVVEMLPILDALDAADDAGELTGGFKLVADEIIKVADKHGLVSFGGPGDPFDPHKHHAMMQVPVPGADEMEIHEVVQRGYQLRELVLRPAKVVVAVPAPEAADAAGAGEQGADTASE